jgi:hypothetical protein
MPSAKGAVGRYRESINPAYSINGIMVEQAKYEVLKEISKIEIRNARTGLLLLSVLGKKV